MEAEQCWALKFLAGEPLLPEQAWPGSGLACWTLPVNQVGSSSTLPAAAVCIGTFMESPCAYAGEEPTCRHCPTGTFLSACNTMLECLACSECDAQGRRLPEQRH